MKIIKAYVFKILFVAIIVYSAFIISMGIAIDEYSLILVPNNILNGARPFIDNANILQLAAIPYLPIVWLVKTILGSTEGMMLVLRYVYFAIYVGVTVYLVATLKKCGYKNASYIAGAFYFMYALGWMNFGYKSGLDIGIIIAICSCMRYYHSKNIWNAVLSGIGISLAVVSYPAAVLLAVAVFVFYMLGDKVDDKSAKVTVKPAFIMFGCCMLLAACFMIYVLTQISFADFLHYFPKILVADNNAVPIYVKIGKAVLYYAGFGTIAFAPIVFKLIFEKASKKTISDKTFRIVLAVYWLLFLLVICLGRVSSVSVSRLTYAFVILMWWSVYFYKKSNMEHKKEVLIFFIIPSILCQIGQVVSTNQGIAIYATGSKYAIMGLIVLVLYEKDRVLTFAVLIATFFFHGIWVAENMGGWGSVFENRATVEQGISKGLKLKPETYEYYKSITEAGSCIEKGEKALVLDSYSNIVYLNSDAIVGASRGWELDFNNDSLMEFYNDSPWMVPDKIIARKGDLDPDVYSCPDTVVGHWIQDEYELLNILDNFVVYVRK